jgi:hypothetical protein
MTARKQRTPIHRNPLYYRRRMAGVKPNSWIFCDGRTRVSPAATPLAGVERWFVTRISPAQLSALAPQAGCGPAGLPSQKKMLSLA